MRGAALTFVLVLAACPPGASSKDVSCRFDGGGSGCTEWNGHGLPELGAIELACTQQGGVLVPERCPAEVRGAGCRIKRGELTETSWPSLTVLLADCEDAGRTLVTGADEGRDAGTMTPLNDAGMACSMPGSTASTVTFTNLGSVPVVPKWVSVGTCAEIAYAPLPPGGGVNQPTFVGHVWRFRKGDANGPLLLEYTVTAPSGSVGVR